MSTHFCTPPGFKPKETLLSHDVRPKIRYRTYEISTVKASCLSALISLLWTVLLCNSQLRGKLSRYITVSLSKAAILPYLTCCGIVLNICKASDSRKLQRV